MEKVNIKLKYDQETRFVSFNTADYGFKKIEELKKIFEAVLEKYFKGLTLDFMECGAGGVQEDSFRPCVTYVTFKVPKKEAGRFESMDLYYHEIEIEQ